MKWINDRSAGMPMLEEQNRQLLDRFASVKEALDKGGGWNAVHFSIVALIKNFESCAAVEESLMWFHYYPGCAHHKKEHEELLLSLREMQRANLTTGLTKQLIAAAVAATMKHHLTQDRLLVRHLARLRGKRLCLSVA